MTTEPKTVLVFCANEQVDTPHTLDVDGNGEIVMTCTPCGRFIKFPKGTDVTTLKAQLREHKVANEGQLSVESLELAKAQFIESLLADGLTENDEI